MPERLFLSWRKKMIIANDPKIIKKAADNSIDCLKLRKNIPFFIRVLLYFLQKIGIGKTIFCNYPKSTNDDYIVVFDSGVTIKYLKKLKKMFPQKRIIYWYWNDVKYALPPSKIPEDIEKWSYSEHDCAAYGLFFNTQVIIADKKAVSWPILYDVFYVGKDKNRFEVLKEYEKKIRDLGLEVYFHIVGNKNHSLNGKYMNPVSYEQVQDWIMQSRCIFDYYENENMGLSLRPLEALYFKKKLITNNVNIVNYDFYNPSSIFLLGQRDLGELIQFVETPVDYRNDCSQYYAFGNWYKRFEKR